MATLSTNKDVLVGFEEILRDAFKESGETDVQVWFDGKSLQDLVALPVAQQFYKQWGSVDAPGSWRVSPGLILGNRINRDRQNPTILVTQIDRWEIRFHRAPTKGSGTRIE